MNHEKKLRMFNYLVKMGFKEIEARADRNKKSISGSEAYAQDVFVAAESQILALHIRRELTLHPLRIQLKSGY